MDARKEDSKTLKRKLVQPQRLNTAIVSGETEPGASSDANSPVPNFEPDRHDQTGSETDALISKKSGKRCASPTSVKSQKKKTDIRDADVVHPKRVRDKSPEPGTSLDGNCKDTDANTRRPSTSQALQVYYRPHSDQSTNESLSPRPEVDGNEHSVIDDFTYEQMMEFIRLQRWLFRKHIVGNPVNDLNESLFNLRVKLALRLILPGERQDMIRLIQANSITGVNMENTGIVLEEYSQMMVGKAYLMVELAMYLKLISPPVAQSFALKLAEYPARAFDIEYEKSSFFIDEPQIAKEITKLLTFCSKARAPEEFEEVERNWTSWLSSIVPDQAQSIKTTVSESDGSGSENEYDGSPISLTAGYGRSELDWCVSRIANHTFDLAYYWWIALYLHKKMEEAANDDGDVVLCSETVQD